MSLLEFFVGSSDESSSIDRTLADNPMNIDPDRYDIKYSYIPICTSKILVLMKNNYEVHIILRTQLAVKSDMYEIIIRRQSNTVCEIKKNDVNVVTVDTKSMYDIMSSIVHLKWYCDGMLIISTTSNNMMGEPLLLMSYKDKRPFIINYLGADVRDIDFAYFGHQLTTKYIIQIMKQQLLDTCRYWFHPRNERASSYDLEAIFEGECIGRAHLASAVIPGVVIGQQCIISYHMVYYMDNYEVLCIPRNKVVKWLPPEYGKIPLYALPAGEAENGETLFIGKVLLNYTNYIGNIRQRYKKCFIADNNVEMPISDYLFLTVYDRDIDDQRY